MKQNESERVVPMKKKSTMVILAVFFSYWAWLYTYRYDAWKFWLNIILNLTLFWTLIVPIVTWIWAIGDAAGYDKDVLETYYI